VGDEQSSDPQIANFSTLVDYISQDESKNFVDLCSKLIRKD